MNRAALISFAESLSAKLSKDEITDLFLIMKSASCAKFADELYLTKEKNEKTQSKKVETSKL